MSTHNICCYEELTKIYISVMIKYHRIPTLFVLLYGLDVRETNTDFICHSKGDYMQHEQIHADIKYSNCSFET